LTGVVKSFPTGREADGGSSWLGKFDATSMRAAAEVELVVLVVITVQVLMAAMGRAPAWALGVGRRIWKDSGRQAVVEVRLVVAVVVVWALVVVQLTATSPVVEGGAAGDETCRFGTALGRVATEAVLVVLVVLVVLEEVVRGLGACAGAVGRRSEEESCMVVPVGMGLVVVVVVVALSAVGPVATTRTVTVVGVPVFLKCEVNRAPRQGFGGPVFFFRAPPARVARKVTLVVPKGGSP
jgi:hypothetical protein